MNTEQQSQAEAPGANAQHHQHEVKAEQNGRETRRWWIKLTVQPLLFLLCGAALIISLGLAQKAGWITAGGGGGGENSATADTRVHLPHDVYSAAGRTRAMPGLRNGTCSSNG